jgi:hypothetical protein
MNKRTSTVVVCVMLALAVSFSGCGKLDADGALKSLRSVRHDEEERRLDRPSSAWVPDTIKVEWGVLRNHLVSVPDITLYVRSLPEEQQNTLYWTIMQMYGQVSVDSVLSERLRVAARAAKDDLEFLGSDPASAGTWMRQETLRIVGDRRESVLRTLECCESD